MNFQLMIDSLPELLSGAVITLKLIGASAIAGALLAVPLALMRVSKRKWLKIPAFWYIYFFRGTPLLVQLFIIYYGFSQFDFIKNSVILWSILENPYWCAVIAFTLNTAGYTGEILRGAIQSVPRGQIEAGLSVGMSRFLILKRIIAPQAVTLALPGYSNEIILLLKGSALASTVTLMEITGVARNIIAETFMSIELFAMAGIFYLILTFVVTRIFKMVEHKLTAFRRGFV